MKNFRDYLKESEQAADTPVVGDTFAINIREECLIESVVVETRSDGVVIAADQRMMQLLESYGYSFEESELTESHFAVGDRVKCRKSGMTGHVVKLDKDHGAADDQYYTVKRDDGQLKKMAPEDMTKIDEQVQEFKDEPQHDLDANEYDQEGDMAKTELQTMIRSARRLQGLLGDDDNMPEWTQKKITKATDYVDTAADYIASQKERGVMEDDAVPNPVARAILHRIMMQHTGLLAQYGPEQVMNAVDDVAEYIGDVEEIGTSDVSEYVRAVQQMLGGLRESGVAEGIEDVEAIRDRIAALQRDLKAVRGSYPGDDRNRSLIRSEIFRAKEELKAARGKKTGVNEAATMASVSKLLRHIERHHTNWFDDYGMGEVEDTVVDMAEQGTFSGMTVVDAAALVGQELESMYGTDAMNEAEYQGRKVQLNKKMSNPDGKSKSKVYVRDPKTGNVKKVTFGDPNMKIRKSNPGARKSFRARHNCDNPGPKTKARYWSCRSW